MKKAILGAMVIMASAALSFGAYAEEGIGSTVDNPVVFNYAEDIDESVYDGMWVDTGLGFDVYLPDDWDVSEVTEEMVDAGVVFVAGEDEETGGANMVITLTELPEEAAGYDVEQLGVELAQNNTTALYADLSGLPAVIFENDETEISGFAMLTENGYLITGVISAAEGMYEEYGPYFMNMTASISPSEDEAMTEMETE